MSDIIRGTDLVQCPWCGTVERDSHEWHGQGIHRCDECRGYYQFNRITNITYTTEPVGEDPLHGEQAREAKGGEG